MEIFGNGNFFPKSILRCRLVSTSFPALFLILILRFAPFVSSSMRSSSSSTSSFLLLLLLFLHLAKDGTMLVAACELKSLLLFDPLSHKHITVIIL